MIRRRWVLKILSQLDEKGATGPDQLPAIILKQCRQELVGPITLLVRQMIATGAWPAGWRAHWTIPLFKKGGSFDANNYRGVHQTPAISKVVERSLAYSLIKCFRLLAFTAIVSGASRQDVAVETWWLC